MRYAYILIFSILLITVNITLADECPYAIIVNYNGLETEIIGNITIGNDTFIINCDDALEIIDDLNNTINNFSTSNISNVSYTNWDKLNASFNSSTKDYWVVIQNFSTVPVNISYGDKVFVDNKILYLLITNLSPFNNTFATNTTKLNISYTEENDPSIEILDFDIVVEALKYSNIQILAYDDTEIRNITVKYQNKSEILSIKTDNIYSGALSFNVPGDEIPVEITAYDYFNNSKSITHYVKVIPRQLIKVNEYKGIISSSKETTIPIISSKEQTVFNISLSNIVPNSTYLIYALSQINEPVLLEENKTYIISGSDIFLKLKPQYLLNGGTLSFYINVSTNLYDRLEKNNLSYKFEIGEQTRFDDYQLKFGELTYSCYSTDLTYICNTTYPKYSFDISDFIVPMPTRSLETYRFSCENSIRLEHDGKIKAENNLWTVLTVFIVAVIIVGLYWLFVIKGLTSLRG